MRKKSLYPITMKLLADRKSLVYEIFRSVKPNKGVFIGVCKLEGSFLCDNPEHLYNTLTVGERLSVELDETDRLAVKRTDGTNLGILPFMDSVLPKMILSRGINIFCYFEAKEFESDMLSIAVSIYCDEY